MTQRRRHTPDLPNACPICAPIRCVKAFDRKTIRKRKIGTIDCTPTWLGLLPFMISIMREAGHPETANIWEELKRMAQAADNFNRLIKELRARGIK